MDAIKVISVDKTFRLGDTEIPALKQVSLTVHQGDFLAITGPSGSGKSTLLNLMACLDLPTEGSVEIHGRCTSKCTEQEIDAIRASHIGMIFQSFNLIPVLSVQENVELPLMLHSLGRAERRERVNRALKSVGMESFSGYAPSKLSGGQRQRIGIARALVTAPRVIIADEPTANLDSENATAVIEEMRRLNHVEGVTFVFSTHDQRLVGSVDREIVLRDGCMFDSDERHTQC